MDIKQDPNAIPNFNSGGRIGELQPNQPEQSQSSVQLDATADGDGAASGDIPAGSGQDSPLDNGSSATAKPGPPAGADGAPPAPRDPSTTGGGAIDGLVGAP